MSQATCLLAQQTWIGVAFYEDEDCYVIEQSSGLDEQASSIYISSWNLADFIQRLQAFEKTIQKGIVHGSNP